MGYIFEQEIETIINVVRTRTIGEADGILLKHILRAPIHPSIKAYFRAEVEKVLHQEHAREFLSKKLAYGIPEVVSLRKQIDKLLLLNYQFTREEFESLLDESVHFQFNYLCRPRWTLINFIFGTNRTVSTTHIETKLTYCVDYSYFVHLIKQYCTARGLTELKYEEFQTLVKRIDDEVIALHAPAELARMLKPLFTFLQATLPPTTDVLTIPINAAIVFFEDKQLHSIRERLEHERDVKAHNHVTMEDLTALIESLYDKSTPPEPVLEHEQLTIVQEPPVEQLNPQLQYSLTESTTLSNQQNQVTNELIQPEAIEKETETSVIPEKEHVEQEAIPPSYDVTTLFPKKVYDKLLRVLFQRDARKFNRVLSEILALQHWDDVAHYLDGFYLVENIDPFCEEAVLFTDILYEYYHTKK